MSNRAERAMVDSGVEWIEDIPGSWKVVRLRDVSKISSSPRTSGDKEVSFVPMERVGYGKVDVTEHRRGDDVSNYVPFKDGDVIIAKVTPCFENGKVAVADGLKNGRGAGSSEIVAFSCNDCIFNKYLMYIFSCSPFVRAGEATMNGTAGLKRVGSSFWVDTAIPAPPLHEQHLIATYLDCQTDRIDRERDLITKKIALLKQERQALIFECVTGKRTIVEVQHLAGDGGDRLEDVVFSGNWAAVPTAKAGDPLRRKGQLVDSGVDWIGDVPEGWSMAKIKECGRFQSGRATTFEDDGMYPVYGSSKKSFARTNYSSSKSAVCIGRKGTIDTPFFVAEPFWAVDTCLYNNVDTGLALIRFFYYWTEIVPWKDFSTKTALPSLTQEDVNNIQIALPKLSEQHLIASFMDSVTNRIDREIRLLDRKIDLLADQRKALIFEAVTGKMDLRSSAEATA